MAVRDIKWYRSKAGKGAKVTKSGWQDGDEGRANELWEGMHVWNYTVEPLYRGHQWNPAGCPVYSGTSL